LTPKIGKGRNQDRVNIERGQTKKKTLESGEGGKEITKKEGWENSQNDSKKGLIPSAKGDQNDEGVIGLGGKDRKF